LVSEACPGVIRVTSAPDRPPSVADRCRRAVDDRDQSDAAPQAQRFVDELAQWRSRRRRFNENAQHAVALHAPAENRLRTSSLSWRLDENTGAALNDGSGNGRNGAATSTSWTTGFRNCGLSFNGSASKATTSAAVLFWSQSQHAGLKTSIPNPRLR
jgi:hypothetical protein